MLLKSLFILVSLVMLCAVARGGAIGGSTKAAFSRCASAVTADLDAAGAKLRLARVTAYWPGEDYFTNRHMTATGARLQPGFCAVDSRIIPYGSVVTIPGVGKYVAMDTGTAVISRKAARESGRNREERNALVIDLYFASRRAGELFSREGPKFAMVAWSLGG
jgi:3D (Asp-Asp-Asp) domain-containing protein